MNTSVPLRIDFVSDVACPWCAVGLKSLEQALAQVGDAIPVALHFQPFELNPDMPPEGEDADAHLARKYGTTQAQLVQNREALRQRGAAVGFVFNRRERVYNTFDAHRLLHWAGTLGAAPQLALKHALLKAYFTDGEDVSAQAVLIEVAAASGLDRARATQVLADGEFADAVRAQEQLFQSRGISAVPSVVINERHLIQGGQPPEMFEQALRQIAAERASVA